MPIYMKYEGVKGSVTKLPYKGWIELESCQMGVHRNVTSATGRGANREASVPSVSEIVITKYQDSSSTGLFKEALGSEGKKVTIVFVNSDGPVSIEYMKIELENTMVLSFNSSGSGGGTGKPMESLSLNFTKITYTTASEGQLRNDKSSKASQTMYWDIPDSKTN